MSKFFQLKIKKERNELAKEIKMHKTLTYNYVSWEKKIQEFFCWKNRSDCQEMEYRFVRFEIMRIA